MKNTVFSIIILILTTQYTLADDVIPFIEMDLQEEGKAISFKWQNSNGEVATGVWKKQLNDLWYRKINSGCGLVGFCDRDSLIIKNFNDKCIYINNDNNTYRIFSHYKPFKLQDDAECTAFSKEYLVHDVSESFEFTSNSVKIIDDQYSFTERRPYFGLDVSADGKKITTSLIRDQKQEHPSIYHFDLTTQKATKITFPRYGLSFAGFINDRDFIVVHRVNNEVYDFPDKYDGFVDGNLGLIHRFGQEMSGELVKIINSGKRGLCQFDMPQKLDVSSRGLSIAADSGGVCGFQPFSAEAIWENDSLKVKQLSGLGDPGSFVPQVTKKEKPLIYYGRQQCNRNNGSCNVNDSFYEVTLKKDALTVNQETRNGVVLNDYIPQKGYLIPVWKKEYKGPDDINATMQAYTENNMLHLQITVEDDHLVFSNENPLNNDHAEIWFFTHPSSSNKIDRQHYSGWIGQSHYLADDEYLMLLDEEFYPKVGVDNKLLRKFASDVKSQKTVSSNGYTQTISVPLNKLPFYQLSENRQCFSVMVDIIDVDLSGKQETLLSNNISRKWGNRDFAPSICFDLETDLSLDSMANQKGLVAIENNFTIVVNDGEKLSPMQFAISDPKLSPFSKIEKVNYEKLELLSLPDEEIKKIIHGGNAIGPCPLKKVSYNKQSNLLFIISDCNRGGYNASLTVYKLGEEKLLVDRIDFYWHCYRHCDYDDGYDLSSLEYGVLDQNIHVVQIHESAIVFNADSGLISVIKNTKFPKLANDIKMAIQTSVQDASSKYRAYDYPIFYIKNPVFFEGDQLDIVSKKYTSPIFPYSSFSPLDIECLEGLAVTNFLQNNNLELPSSLDERCISAHFDRAQLKHNLGTPFVAKKSIEEYDKVIPSNYSSSFNEVAIENMDSSLESLSLSLNKPEEIRLIPLLAKFENLRSLHLRIGVIHDLNTYLAPLSDLKIESFSFEASGYDENFELMIPFSESLKKIKLSMSNGLDRSVRFPKATDVDIGGWFRVNDTVNIFEIFPNVVSITVSRLPDKISIFPKTLKHLNAGTLPNLDDNFNYTVFKDLESLSVGDRNILPRLIALDIPTITHRDGARLINKNIVREELSAYFDASNLDELITELIKNCNGSNNSDALKSTQKIVVNPRCVSSTFWKMNMH